MNTHEPANPPKVLLTIREVMRRLKVSESTVYRLVNQGHIRIVHVGRSSRVPEDSLNSYIDSLMSNPFGG